MHFVTGHYLKEIVSPLCWLCNERKSMAWDLCFSCFRDLRSAMAYNSSLFVYDPKVAKLIRKSRSVARIRSAKIFWKIAELNGALPYWRGQKFHRVLWIPQGKQQNITGLEIFARNFARERKISASCGFRKIQNTFQHQKKRKDRMDREIFFKYIGPPLKGERILLLDDVLSTGTSLDQAKYLLKREGASCVKTFALVENLMSGFEGQGGESKEKGHEMEPFLFHLFV
jgi:predicted amidophosphoribosyltransferase